MLDRAQHLKLFLTGSGDSQKDVDAVLSDHRPGTPIGTILNFLHTCTERAIILATL